MRDGQDQPILKLGNPAPILYSLAYRGKSDNGEWQQQGLKIKHSHLVFRSLDIAIWFAQSNRNKWRHIHESILNQSVQSLNVQLLKPAIEAGFLRLRGYQYPPLERYPLSELRECLRWERCLCFRPLWMTTCVLGTAVPMLAVLTAVPMC